jgi:hypothetical protein
MPFSRAVAFVEEEREMQAARVLERTRRRFGAVLKAEMT